MERNFESWSPPRKSISVLSVLYLVCVSEIFAAIVRYKTCDLSKEADAKGEDVVDEAIRKLKLATPDWEDYSLMKRLAYVESDFGEDDFVMENNTNGGIWQVTSSIYGRLKNNTSLNNISSLLHQLQDYFEIDCFLCDFDYSTPLRSALAARLYIYATINTSIPESVEDQANWWSSHYNDNRSSLFTEKVMTLEADEDQRLEMRMDMWFMVDGSETVSDVEFSRSVEFACNLTSKFELSSDRTRVGFSVYSEANEILCTFENNTNLEKFRSTAESAITKKKRKQFDKALEEIYEHFKNDQNINDSYHKVIFFITNQGSNDDLNKVLEKACFTTWCKPPRDICNTKFVGCTCVPWF